MKNYYRLVVPLNESGTRLFKQTIRAQGKRNDIIVHKKEELIVTNVLLELERNFTPETRFLQVSFLEMLLTGAPQNRHTLSQLVGMPFFALQK